MKRLHRPSPAMTVALIALFVALGGTGYAALRLPKNSVGSKQIKRNAVSSSKVADGSLLAGDFKAGQLPAGKQGPQGSPGAKGDPCAPTEPACKGPKGDSGDRGPGTVTLDGQVDLNDLPTDITTVENQTLNVTCKPGNADVRIEIRSKDNVYGFFGWGTRWTGTELQRATVTQDSFFGIPFAMRADGTTTAELDVVVKASPSLQTGNYTRWDVSLVRGSKCNYHALIIPPS